MTTAVEWLGQSLTLDEITVASNSYPNLFASIAGQIAFSLETIKQHEAMLSQNLENVRALNRTSL